MLEIAFLVLDDGRAEMVDGVLIAPLTPGDAPVRRLDVSQRKIVVGLEQGRLCLLQDRNRLLRVSFLKVKPALQYAHHSRHRLVPKSGSQFPALDRVGQRLIVVAFHPYAAGLPEISDGQQFQVARLVLQTEYDIEVSD